MTMSANVPAAKVTAAKVTAAKVPHTMVAAAKVTAAEIAETKRSVEWPRIIAWPVIAWPIATSIIVRVVAPSCRDYADWVRGIRFRSRRRTRRHRGGTIRRPRVIRLHAA